MHTVGYILSHSFSGSTLLTLALAAHSEIATVGELVGVNVRILSDEQAALDYLCSCGEKVAECPFWKELSARLERQGVEFRHPRLGTRFTLSSIPFLNQVLVCSLRNQALENVREWLVQSIPPFRQRFKKIAATNAVAVEQVLRMAGKKVLIDESKSHVRFVRLASIPTLNVRPIFLTRDGRGVAMSARNRGVMDFAHAAKSWARFNKNAERMIAATTHACLHVRYEDLCAQPSDTLQKIHRFLGLNPEPWPPPKRLFEHHILGNDMRLRFDGTITFDARWQRELTEQELQIFSQSTGNMNGHFGYE